MSKRTILLAAGGTAGHLYPASALAQALKMAGFEPHLATDKRGAAYVAQLETMPTHRLPAATIFGTKRRGWFALPISLAILLVRFLTLITSFFAAFYLVVKLRPQVVVGFGGYPSFAPVAMALLLRRPSLIHEQNAVLGRANRMLAKLGAHLATGFAQTSHIPKNMGTQRMHHTGNPLRAAVLDAAQGQYRGSGKTDTFDLLVFGGSQGAHIFADIVPQAIAALPPEAQSRLRVAQQSRKADIANTLRAYGALHIDAEIRDYFDDIPRRMRQAHLVICRGGASTISELAAIGAPAIIVPLQAALDQDQARNAAALTKAGGAWVLMQNDFTPQTLANRISALMDDEATLRQAAGCAKTLAMLDATQRLHQCVQGLAPPLHKGGIS